MLETILFYMFGGLVVAAAMGIAVGGNIVRMAYWLIGLLGGVAGLFFLMGLFFLGAVQLLVYVGGVAVLVVFGVMLTARQGEARIRGGRWETAVAAVVCVMLLVGLLIAMHCSPWTQTALSKLPTVKDVGNYLLGEFLFMFELASVLLLVVMIAAAYLARPRATKQRAQKIRKAGNKSV